MKAVIVEIKDSFVAVLSDDGRIKMIKNNKYEIGQVIQMSNPKIRFNKKIAALAASAAAFVMIGVGSWAYANPYTYVSVDVNPSIEFTVNRFDRVIHVKAVNDDGEEVLKDISLGDLENKTIEDAITSTVQEITDLGYFDGPIEGGIVIATSSENEEKADDLAEELQDAVETEVAENGDDVNVEAFSVGLERVEQARELGVTPGKLNLVEKLQAASADPNSINIEEWLNKPVKEIMKTTKDYKKAAAISGSSIIIKPKNDKEAAAEEKAAEKQKAAEEKAAKKANKAGEKATLKDKTSSTKQETSKTDDSTNVKHKDTETKKVEKANSSSGKSAEKTNSSVDKTTGKTKNSTESTSDKATSNDQKSDKTSNKTDITSKPSQESADSNTGTVEDTDTTNTNGNDADTNANANENANENSTQNGNGKGSDNSGKSKG